MRNLAALGATPAARSRTTAIEGDPPTDMPEATRQYLRDLEAVRTAISHDAPTETRLDLEQRLAASEANLFAAWAGWRRSPTRRAGESTSCDPDYANS